MYYESLQEKFNEKVSNAVKLQYEKIAEAIEKDYNSRLEALEAWNGLGLCPILLVQGYTIDLQKGVLHACSLMETSEILKVEIAYKSFMVAKLREKGWEKVNETTYRLI